MKLYDLLKVMNPDEYIGLWDVDVPVTLPAKARRRRFGDCPTPQQYFKVRNLPLKRVMYYLEKDILWINHTEKGFVVRLHDSEKLHREMNNYDLARKIAKEFDRA